MESAREYLSSGKVNINQVDSAGDTLLMRSILRFHLPEISLYLIESGADVTIRNLNQSTALHFAVRHGVEIANKLIVTGADVHAADKYGYTPLHEAVFYNNYSAVCMLLYYGANANVQCHQLMTPFMMAIEKNVDMKIQKVLFEHAADIHEMKNKKGCNTLLLAMGGGSEIAIELFKLGVDVNQLVPGKNALDLAIRSNCYIPHFKEIFEKSDYDVLIASGCPPLLFTLLYLRLETPVWYELLELLVYSSQHEKIIQHCINLYKHVFLSKLFQEFFYRNIGEDLLAEFLAIFLMFGAEVYIADYEMAYEFFGNNRVFKMLSEHDVIINRIRSPSLPLIMADTVQRPSYYFRYHVATFHMLIVKTQLKNLQILLRFCTPPRTLQIRLKRYLTRILKREDVDQSIKTIIRQIIEKLNQLQVPSLKELSRDVGRRAISSYYGNGTSMFHTVVKQENLCDVVKKILYFQKEVN